MQNKTICMLKILKGGPKTCCFIQNREVIDMRKPRALDLCTNSCNLWGCNQLPQKRQKTRLDRCHAPNMFGTVNMGCTVNLRLSWSE